MSMRVVTGGISHETSTFTPVDTHIYSADERFGYLHGAEILRKFQGENTPTGGFIDGAEAHGFELVPTVFWEAHPSGPLSRSDFESILQDLLDGIDAAERSMASFLNYMAPWSLRGTTTVKGKSWRPCDCRLGKMSPS